MPKYCPHDPEVDSPRASPAGARATAADDASSERAAEDARFPPAVTGGRNSHDASRGPCAAPAKSIKKRKPLLDILDSTIRILCVETEICEMALL